MVTRSQDGPHASSAHPQGVFMAVLLYNTRAHVDLSLQCALHRKDPWSNQSRNRAVQAPERLSGGLHVWYSSPTHLCGATDRTAHVRGDDESERPLPHDVVFSVQSRISSSTEKVPRSSPHSPTTLLQRTGSMTLIRVAMLASYSSRVLRKRLHRL